MTNQSHLPETLYHYCSPEAFIQIIQNGIIWLVDSYRANDYLESHWINRHINEMIKKHQNDKNRKFFDALVMQYNLHQPRPFIASFSTDGDVLSQWRGYTLDGLGFSVGFKPNSFGVENRLPHTSVVPQQTIGLHEVIYDVEMQRKKVEVIIGKYLYSCDLKNQDSIAEGVMYCSSELIQYSYFFKNPKFSEELEWRIVHIPLISFGSSPSFSAWGSISEIKFTTLKHLIVPYFDLSFRANQDVKPIKEIILGPRNETSPIVLQMLLAKHNFTDVIIRKSEASYR